MNEFLQQFLIESRELIDQASEGLLSLEQSPLDAERLDAVFRAFHTLKGGAGIVEFPLMERAMHAAEDVLSNARSGKQALNPQLVGYCLECLDQVIQWLDVLERTGELPVVGDVGIQQTVNRLDAPAAAENWAAEALRVNPDTRAAALTAVRWIPDRDCFYRAEDPVARMTALPGLLALDLAPVDAWARLETFDPFSCNLVLTALTATSLRDVTEHMRGRTGECEILAIAAASGGALPQAAMQVLQEQVALLEMGKDDSFIGQVASAGSTAANVLRFCGRGADASMLEAATEKSLRDGTAQPLRDVLVRALGSLETPAEAPKATTATATQAAPILPRTLRIDTGRVDALVRLTGELTVAGNSIGHVAGLATASNDSVANLLKSQHDILARLVLELQQSVLGMRVLPLRSVLQRFPRVVRDMSASLGKPVKLDIAGDDTEADKAIVEMLFEPLLHIVRNAIDHGVELPVARAARGKPPVAAVQIRATRQGDRVHIEVIDDGGGIDVDRVREVAKARGVATDEVLRVMTEAEVIDLVFAPGFSTAAQVTELSGRGVGMDAVRSTVERIGGRVSIDSRSGYGTTVRLSLPFSVMMTDVMTVEVGGQMFGIPLDVVVETVRVGNETIAGVGAGRATVLRDRTVPVFDLAHLLDAGHRGLAHQGRSEAAEAVIVVVAVAGQFGGIQVDRLGGRMQIMLAPLEGLLSGTPGIAGTSLLGDGRVLLVLDVGELLQ